MDQDERDYILSEISRVGKNLDNCSRLANFTTQDLNNGRKGVDKTNQDIAQAEVRINALGRLSVQYYQSLFNQKKTTSTLKEPLLPKHAAGSHFEKTS